jgi:hypothetical protein
MNCAKWALIAMAGVSPKYCSLNNIFVIDCFRENASDKEVFHAYHRCGVVMLAVVIYNEARELLQLEFRSRTVYRYFGVPARVPEGLLRAPSRGRYFKRGNPWTFSPRAGREGG